MLPEVDFKGLSWHQHKHIIAFISGRNQVIVRDYEDSGLYLCTFVYWILATQDLPVFW